MHGQSFGCVRKSYSAIPPAISVSEYLPAGQFDRSVDRPKGFALPNSRSGVLIVIRWRKVSRRDFSMGIFR